MDIWSTGVIAYYILVGYTPFDLATTDEKRAQVVAGVYRFEPEKYWDTISETAKDFIKHCLVVDHGVRPTAETVLGHKWLTTEGGCFVSDPQGSTDEPYDLLPNAKEGAKKKHTWHPAQNGKRALERYTYPLVENCLGGDFETMRRTANEWVDESDKEDLNESSIVHHLMCGRDVSVSQ